MAFDTIAAACIAKELNEKLTGAKVEKIYQPEKDELSVNLKTFTDNYRLTISASPTNPRVHFSKEAKQNPQNPPMFCMLMRKHITSGKVVKVYSVKNDRIIIIDIETYNDFGDLTIKHIILEMMGRYSNIILTSEDNTIIDSIKHIDFTMSEERQILPGMVYSFPPLQKKTPILSEDMKKITLDKGEKNIRADKILLSQIGGISPLTAREITYRALGRCDILRDEIADWDAFCEKVRAFPADDFKPCLITEKESGRLLDFSAIDINQYESLANIEYFDSMSDLLENFYKSKDSAERMKQKSNDILKVLHNNIAKTSKKIGILKSTLDEAENKEKYRKFGDLLVANLYKVEQGAERVSVTDYFSEEQEEIEIPLSPMLTPSQNSQRYYKLYNKAKTAQVQAALQLKNASEDLEYLESTLSLLENCSCEDDISAIRNELEKMGYLKIRRKGKKKPEKETSKPHHYISSDGFDIYVGKNNTQNDKLTLKFANSADIWFHTKKIHGSHVIIKLGKDKEVPERTMTEAAALAAYFSKARESSRVPVDYTQIKNVKKPNGAKPGMVIYDSYNTIYVNPEIREGVREEQ